MGPLFNVPKFKVFPHFIFNFNDPNSVTCVNPLETKLTRPRRRRCRVRGSGTLHLVLVEKENLLL